MLFWLFLILAYLPFQIALNPGVVLAYFGWHNQFLKGIDLASLRVLIIVFFLALFLSSIIKNKPNFKNWIFYLIKDWRLWAMLAFLFFSLISLIGAESVWWGLRKIMFFLSIFPLYVVVVTAFKFFGYGKAEKLEQIKKASLFLCFSCALVAVFGIFQFISPFIFGLDKVQDFWASNIVAVFSGFNLGNMILSSPSWFVNVWGVDIMRAFSIFSDPHMFSFFLGLVLPLCLSCAFLVKNKKLRFILSCCFILIYLGALLSFARGSYLALIVSLSGFLFLLWFYLSLSLKKKILALSALILAFSLFIIPITPIAGRFYSSFNLDEGSNQGRLEMWRVSANQGLEHGFYGLGLGNYALAVNSKTGYRNSITAHNLYLDLFSEVGSLGLLPWLALIFGSIFELWRKLRRNIDFNRKILIVGLMSSLVYFSVHSFFETAIYNPVILSVFLLILGFSKIICSGSLSQARSQ